MKAKKNDDNYYQKAHPLMFYAHPVAGLFIYLLII